MNISELIDEIIRVKAERESLNTLSSTLTSRLVTLERDLMEAMSAAGTTKAASTAGHSCKMEKKVYPAIKDWNAFYNYVQETNSFDLLHKRLSNTAFRDRWAAGEEIPGTSSSEIWEIAITKSRS